MGKKRIIHAILDFSLPKVARNNVFLIVTYSSILVIYSSGSYIGRNFDMTYDLLARPTVRELQPPSNLARDLPTDIRREGSGVIQDSVSIQSDDHNHQTERFLDSLQIESGASFSQFQNRNPFPQPPGQLLYTRIFKNGIDLIYDDYRENSAPISLLWYYNGKFSFSAYTGNRFFPGPGRRLFQDSNAFSSFPDLPSGKTERITGLHFTMNPDSLHFFKGLGAGIHNIQNDSGIYITHFNDRFYAGCFFKRQICSLSADYNINKIRATIDIIHYASEEDSINNSTSDQKPTETGMTTEGYTFMQYRSLRNLKEQISSLEGDMGEISDIFAADISQQQIMHGFSLELDRRKSWDVDNDGGLYPGRKGKSGLADFQFYYNNLEYGFHLELAGQDIQLQGYRLAGISLLYGKEESIIIRQRAYRFHNYEHPAAFSEYNGLHRQRQTYFKPGLGFQINRGKLLFRLLGEYENNSGLTTQASLTARFSGNRGAVRLVAMAAETEKAFLFLRTGRDLESSARFYRSTSALSFRLRSKYLNFSLTSVKGKENAYTFASLEFRARFHATLLLPESYE